MHSSTLLGTRDTPLHLLSNSTNSSPICKCTILKLLSQNQFSCTQSNFQCIIHTWHFHTENYMTQQILSAHSSMVLQQVVLQYTRGSGPAHNKCQFIYMYNHFLGQAKRREFTKKILPIISCYTSYVPNFQINCIP
jgi:hypothetical protein